MALVTLAMAQPAAAQDATWLLNPGSNDFNTGANWTPATVPTGTAFFDASNTRGLSLTSAATLGGMTLTAGASSYSLNNSSTLTFNGAGIDVQGGALTIANTAFSGTITFNNASTAGSASFTNGFTSQIGFFDSSTAASAGR